MRRGALLLLTLAMTLGFAPAPLPRAERRPKLQNQMIGTWQGGSTIQITHDRLTYHPGSPSRCEYELRIDTNARPWRYDITGVQGTSTAGRIYAGIYRIEGGTLTLYYNHGTNRPASFGNSAITEVYKRSAR